MARARLMDQPDDFIRLGINPERVEPWEDGRRDSSAPGHGEVYYFDAILDDGGKVVIGFHPKDPLRLALAEDAPRVGIIITTSDGLTHEDNWTYPAKDAHFGTEQCDVHVGPHRAVGDFSSYDVHVEPVNGTGADLHYDALVKPYRQGTAIIALGENEEFYYSDLSVPNNRVTGTVTVDGTPHQVTGFGYHDHQWMNITPIQAWHHWLWGHMSTPDYTVLIFDLVANAQFDFTPVPLFGVMEHSAGDVIFATDGHFTRHTELRHQDKTDKDFPKISDYTFTNADGTTVELRIEWQQEIEVRTAENILSNPDPAFAAKLASAGLSPAYIRYYATADLTLNGPNGNRITQSGPMIYEYPYFGKPDPRARV